MTYSRARGARAGLSERLWSRVNVGQPDACWEFVGYRSPRGYGMISSGGRRGRMVFTHRAAYEDAIGPIPDGLCVMHLCDNPACCNPRHLRVGSHMDNMADMKAKGRARSGNTEPHERCKRGHVLAESAKIRKNGERLCLPCSRVRYWIRQFSGEAA